MVVSPINIKSVFTISFFCLSFFLSAQETEASTDALKTVVIDAGHGGKDPGCHGKSIKEKDLALSVALKLGAFIQKEYPSVNVIYTRDKDVFIELNERARIANDNNADLFISIHANAASPSAYGSETFVLGLHRTESQQKVAERENSIIHFEEDSEEKYADFDLSPDAIIARQIQLSAFLDQSIDFASKIQNGFKAIGRHDRGVKQAGFLVLYKTTMPSVLIELGFLTNSAEENFYKQELNQVKAANMLFKAFQSYKNEVEGVQKLIVDGDGYNEAVEEIEKEMDKTKEVEANKHLIFKVQIATSKVQLLKSDQRFKGVTVFEYKQDNLFKYTSGHFHGDLESAKIHKEKMMELGFEHAFVVAFLNNERISMSEALKMLD